MTLSFYLRLDYWLIKVWAWGMAESCLLTGGGGGAVKLNIKMAK